VGSKGGGHVQRVHTNFQNATMLTHGIFGIGAEIHHDLMNLGDIREHGSPLRRHALPNLNGGWQRGSEQFEGFLDHCGESHGFPVLLTRATEGDNLLHQVFRPPARVEHFL
jgi:hypothetical protein